jgi:hypothetical protein
LGFSEGAVFLFVGEEIILVQFKKQPAPEGQGGDDEVGNLWFDRLDI